MATARVSVVHAVVAVHTGYVSRPLSTPRRLLPLHPRRCATSNTLLEPGANHSTLTSSSPTPRDGANLYIVSISSAFISPWRRPFSRPSPASGIADRWDAVQPILCLLTTCRRIRTTPGQRLRCASYAHLPYHVCVRPFRISNMTAVTRAKTISRHYHDAGRQSHEGPCLSQWHHGYTPRATFPTTTRTTNISPALNHHHRRRSPTHCQGGVYEYCVAVHGWWRRAALCSSVALVFWFIFGRQPRRRPENAIQK